MSPAGGARRAGRRRLRRWLLAVCAAVLAISVLPVLVLAVLPAPTSAFMLRYQLNSALADAERPPLRYHWVEWEQIAEPMKLAVIASEDQRFTQHFGIDLQAVEQALEERSEGRLRGASTISQQTAKNLFLWPGRSWLRKGLEVGYTLLIEALWSKRRLLTVYLNIAEFGPGVYGVEAAAQHHFGRPASALTRHQAALLAVSLPNPLRYNASRPTPWMEGRAAWVERQMRQLGPAALPP